MNCSQKVELLSTDRFSAYIPKLTISQRRTPKDQLEEKTHERNVRNPKK